MFGFTFLLKKKKKKKLQQGISDRTQERSCKVHFCNEVSGCLINERTLSKIVTGTLVKIAEALYRQSTKSATNYIFCLLINK
jgi:hypothetical protein